MHIPDGYLSPTTCAALYVTAAPFWYFALKRVQKALHTSLVPLVSVFAAFSFVVMMFNLPLPGGTTGHAVGMGIATVVLGPWAAMLAISVALTIQAIFFGDGGITTLGANCFNMAIAGSVVAYVCYRAVAWRAGLWSPRRVVAAGIAGYAGLNVSALCAAVEFGIQPLFFHDAAGVPLYCPYPLSVSIPAMMIGHLTFAGLAELIVSAGLVGYLQRTDPALLKSTAQDAPDRDRVDFVMDGANRLPSARKLWAALAFLLILTPLGILAGGSAWGEWNPLEVAGQLHTAVPPRGMARLATIWTAPLSRYAPPFIASERFGYAVSAMVGAGLIVFGCLLISKLLGNAAPAIRTSGFIERTMHSLMRKADKANLAEEMASLDGLLQRLDPRVKVTGLLALLIAAVSVRRLGILVAFLAVGVALGVWSRVPVSALAKRVWLPVLSFSGLIALPALFLVPGEVVFRGPPAITSQGLLSAGLLILRVETASTFAVLLVLSTEWMRVLKALRFFRVPVVVVVILGMTYRYLFLLLRSALEMFESRQSRLVGRLPGPERRLLASGTVGVLLARSLHLSAEVHNAMRARGFQGEVHLLEDQNMRAADWWHLAGVASVACLAVWLGR